MTEGRQSDDAPAPERGAPPAGVRAPSMNDVAGLAGVSHQTVSRVLGGHPNVRPQTRTRVLAAIQELGYRPNRAARALVTGRSRTVGVVSLNSTLYGPASTLYAIEEAARLAGYFVTVASVRTFDRASLREAVGHLVDQLVEGVIVIAPLTSADEALADLPRDVPVVAVEGDPGTNRAVVRVDQVAGGRRATEHLLSMGHRTVWHVAGPADWNDARGRVDGWRAALDAAGAEVPPPLPGDWSPRAGFEAGRILARMPEVTAVFVANDAMAIGVLRALREHGLRVPEDISIVGFDDVPEAAYLTPPLTTVRQDFEAVGRSGLRLLLDRVDAGRAGDTPHPVAEPVDLLVGTDLVIRHSTAAPRS
jgi:DNA-binding LacI/PurR family transcriptional regulator